MWLPQTLQKLKMFFMKLLWTRWFHGSVSGFGEVFLGHPGPVPSCTDTQDAIRPLNEGSRLRFPGVLGWDPRSRVEGDDGPEIRVQLTSWEIGSWNPISYKVLAPSQVGKLAGFLNHQQLF